MKVKNQYLKILEYFLRSIKKRICKTEKFKFFYLFNFFIFLFSLTGTLYINKNIPVNVPELAKGYFSSVVPGQDVTSHPKENNLNNLGSIKNYANKIQSIIGWLADIRF